MTSHCIHHAAKFTFMVFASLQSIAVLISGCGGNPSSPATHASSSISGSVLGSPFSAKDAIVTTTQDWKSGFYPGTSTVLLLADWNGLCASIQSNVTPVNSRLVIINLAETSQASAQPALDAGTYEVVTDYGDLSKPKVAAAYSSAVNAQCGFTKGFGTTGTVDVANVGSGGLTLDGLLSLAYSNGDSLTGEFSVSETCPMAAVDKYLNRNPTCQ